MTRHGRILWTSRSPRHVDIYFMKRYIKRSRIGKERSEYYKTALKIIKIPQRPRVSMFDVVFSPDFQSDTSGYTLILPSVSVGNVGQLATDLIINALPDVRKIGYIHSAYLHPLIGAEAFDGGIVSTKRSGNVKKRFGNLSTGCEVFESSKHRLLLIQQRTPVIKGKSAAFRLSLRKWIREANIGNVVLLTSSFAHQRLDAQIEEFLCTSSVDPSLLVKFESELKWKILESNNVLAYNIGSSYDDSIVIPGGGISTAYYHECMEDGLPLIILLKFCSEGDNVPDSMELASFLNMWLGIASSVSEPSSRPVQSEWKLPESWRLMFGAGPPSTIF